jgi:uncharacterized spore protein YtfJ
MQVTKDDQDASAADYADEFGQPDKQPTQMSEEEAFGLSEPAAEATATTEAPDGGATEDAPHGEQPTGGDEAGAQAPAEAGADAAAAPVDQEQRLKSWEGRLKARQAELDAREAAMTTSNANEEQASMPLDDEAGAGEGAAEGAAEGEGDAGADADAGAGAGTDPAAVLAEDFGADFVTQLKELIKQVAGESIGGVSATVDQVIADLQNERLQNHFSKIAETHADFMDVVESPEFSAWKAAQADQEQLQATIDGGSARQIVDMLTRFKAAGNAGSAAGDDTEDALDAAEGVRSSGLSLPSEPTASDDFAKAWNEA